VALDDLVQTGKITTFNADKEDYLGSILDPKWNDYKTYRISKTA
jgi:hypothetical protein